MTYKMNNGRKIHLNILYEKKILTYWQGGKNKDRETSMTYPDGTIIYNGDVIPDFDKLIRILESRDSKQTKMTAAGINPTYLYEDQASGKREDRPGLETKVSELCKELDITRQTLYRHYPLMGSCVQMGKNCLAGSDCGLISH
ncbi:hypothetical protein XBFM1_2530023 [Xenorhabdus bovienii str. feltiae Moldova]|uniref:Uncharacterized protein n=1 Tax=Xenorhabdus bovienii str. feltiae Moldova TaxID=1398200 RepID=A0A077NX38_XENBV|nr:hypothetical protein XBFM1_2530023 [Xenorhabdus bovienii str. feltiae Moldova]